MGRPAPSPSPKRSIQGTDSRAGGRRRARRPPTSASASNCPSETRRFRKKPLRYSFSSCHFPLLLNVTPLRSTPISFYLTGTPRRRCARRVGDKWPPEPPRSEEHTSELQSLMRISYAVFCLKKKNRHTEITILRTSTHNTLKRSHTQTQH